MNEYMNKFIKYITVNYPWWKLVKAIHSNTLLFNIITNVYIFYF